jgi:hypothetical protein
MHPLGSTEKRRIFIRICAMITPGMFQLSVRMMWVIGRITVPIRTCLTASPPGSRNDSKPIPGTLSRTSTTSLAVDTLVGTEWD